MGDMSNRRHPGTDAVRPARRGRRLANALVVVVAAGALVVGPALLRHSPRNDSAPTGGALAGSASAADRLDPMSAAPCPTPPRSAQQARGETLPRDAMAVRLCPAEPAGPAATWQPPADALVTGLTGFFRALTTAPLHPDCGPRGAIAVPYTLEALLADGRVLSVDVPRACSPIAFDGRSLSSSAVLESFLTALGRQREQQGRPDGPGSVPACALHTPAPTLAPPVSLGTEFTAFAGGGPCLRSAASKVAERAGRLLSSAWGRSAVAVIADRGFGACPPSGRSPTAYAVTSWGDVVPVSVDGCGGYRLGSFRLQPGRALIAAATTAGVARAAGQTPR